jgi:hypothetical protein
MALEQVIGQNQRRTGGVSITQMLADEQLFFATPTRCRVLRAENALASGPATIGFCVLSVRSGLEDPSGLCDR